MVEFLMINRPNLKNHVAITGCHDINQICTPLNRLGIQIFIYVKVYPDGARMILSNNTEWNEFYFDNFYRLKYPQNIIFERIMQGNLLLSRELYPEIEVFADAAEFFDFGNAIAINKIYQSYKEIFYYCASAKNLQINNYYINNIETLALFSAYFKDKAEPLIKAADKQRLLTPRCYLRDFKNSQYYQLLTRYQDVNNEILKALKKDKVYLPDEDEHSYLTIKQAQCAKWLLQGKSAAEIALILNLSKRTVEEHINNIKTKLNCYKTTQLIYKLSKYHYLFES